MCGILAIYDDSGIEDIAKKAEKALDLMEPRGPDDRGMFIDQNIILGTRRLKVIDITDGGHQPMKSDDGSVVISYNGMIYNFKEQREKLRTKGHKFKTKSDTEVLLRSYQEYGQDFPSTLNGMWGLAIWDSILQSLVVSRDRFGIKPLYKFTDGTRNIFASEIKVILYLIGRKAKISEERLHRFLMRGWLDDKNQTLFENISQVPAGTIHSFTRDANYQKKYWNLEPHKHPKPASFDIAEKIKSSVIKTIQSDVPVGIALSGGLDSSTIASIVGQHSNPECISTFTIIPEGTPDETPKELLDQFNFKHETINFKNIDLSEEFAAVIEANDEPVNGSNSVYQFILRKRMKEAGVKVLLTGEGADELFAGYERSIYPFLSALLEDNNTDEIDRTIKGATQFLGKPSGVIKKEWLQYLEAKTKKQFNQIHEVGLNIIGQRFETYNESLFSEGFPPAPRFGAIKGESFYQHLYGHLFERFVPLVLRIEDKVSGAFGIESRVPFLDHELAEMAWSIEYSEFMEGGRNKTILRNAIQDVVPLSILNNSKKLRKPGNNTIVAYDILKEDLLETISDRSWSRTGILTSTAADLFAKDVETRDSNRSLLWLRVYMVKLWLRYLKKFNIYL